MMRSDIVVAMVVHDKFCSDYEHAYYELNKSKKE